MKLVLVGLLPGDEDEYITGGAFKGSAACSPAASAARSWASTAPAPVRPGPDGLTVRPRS
jgi:hypothetical protein